MDKKYLTIDKIRAYTIAFKLSNYIWDIVMTWDKLSQWTVGKQLIESTDSISANIAEGFGRYHKKDKIRFYRYSFGSMEETKDWIRKCIIRKLINEDEKNHIISELEKLPKEINYLVKFTNEKLKH